MAGHGRAYMLAKANPEKYRDRIMKACENDYTYDIQCEGSRAFLTYDLVSLFDDEEPFVEAMKVSYNLPETDTDRNRLQYLTDLLLMYERAPVVEKYKAIEKMIRADGPLDDISELLQSFEYLAIKLVQNGSVKVLGNVMRDIGLWFASREEEPETLSKYFLWFDSRAEEKFGEDRFDKVLALYPDNEWVESYIRIMSNKPEYSKPAKEEITSETVLSWIRENPSLSRLDMMHKGLMRMKPDEARKLAASLDNETYSDVKAGIVTVFTSERFLWPEDIEVLLYLADDSNDRLRKQAQEALALLKDVRIRELGISLLGEGPRAAALRMIINNIRADDEKMLLRYLNDIRINPDNEGDWHGIGSVILKNADNPELPDSLLVWVYESTLCSYCREGIVEKMLECGIMKENYIEESKWDANLAIRKLVAPY